MNEKYTLAGFTLTELILVTTVIITLAVITIPNYVKSKDKAIQREAISNLKLIAAAERIYKMEQTFYYPVSGTQTGAASLNPSLKLKLHDANWSYSVDNGVTTSGVVTAKGTRGGCVYSINSGNFDSEPSKGGGCT